MHYTCGKDCPAGDNCNNKSLWKRKQPAFKVAYVSTGQGEADFRLLLGVSDYLLLRISRKATSSSTIEER